MCSQVYCIQVIFGWRLIVGEILESFWRLEVYSVIFLSGFFEGGSGLVLDLKVGFWKWDQLDFIGQSSHNLVFLLRIVVYQYLLGQTDLSSIQARLLRQSFQDKGVFCFCLRYVVSLRKLFFWSCMSWGSVRILVLDCLE